MGLRMRPVGDPKELERRRERAIALLEQGLMPVEVARRVGVDRRSVRRWKAAYRKRGAAGLKAKPAPGRPRKMSARERKRLERRLLKGARAVGFDSDLWTCPKVAELLQREFGIEYHVRHVPRVLRGLGFTPQKPARRAVERDEWAIAQWVKQDWPRVKKTLSD